jgi:hypothetical protein
VIAGSRRTAAARHSAPDLRASRVAARVHTSTRRACLTRDRRGRATPRPGPRQWRFGSRRQLSGGLGRLISRPRLAAAENVAICARKGEGNVAPVISSNAAECFRRAPGVTGHSALSDRPQCVAVRHLKWPRFDWSYFVYLPGARGDPVRTRGHPGSPRRSDLRWQLRGGPTTIRHSSPTRPKCLVSEGRVDRRRTLRSAPQPLGVLPACGGAAGGRTARGLAIFPPPLGLACLLSCDVQYGPCCRRQHPWLTPGRSSPDEPRHGHPR